MAAKGERNLAEDLVSLSCSRRAQVPSDASFMVQYSRCQVREGSDRTIPGLWEILQRQTLGFFDVQD